MVGWLVVELRAMSTQKTWAKGEITSVEDLLRGPSPYLRNFSEKTTENAERLSRQV